jgi:hypothetical protein
LEKFRMELDLAGMDAANNDSDVEINVPEGGAGSEDFEISERQQNLQI